MRHTGGLKLTSEERREIRYRNRRAKRDAKRQERLERIGSYEAVFSYANLYAAYRQCRKGVAWKASVQKYIATAPLALANARQRLMTDTFKSPGFHEFTIRERGKERHIRSTVISERVVQRCLCDFALIPALSPSFIYDNGATQRNKGFHFSLKRLNVHLQRHYRQYGTEGYILLFDFSKFFESIPHSTVKARVDAVLDDERIKRLAYHFVDCFGDVGLGLGSQISQVLSLASADRLDHYVKEVLRIKGYGRYMDDGYLIHPSKEYLKKCMREIKAVCDSLGLTLNERKTQIVKLSHGFTWLKARIYLTDTGHIVRKMNRDSVHRERRKLKAFRRKVAEGKMSRQDVYNSWRSWRGYAEFYDSYNTIQSLGRLYNRLFVYEEGNNGLYQGV